MIDYDSIINQLIEESKSCNYKFIDGYTTVVPAYYQNEIGAAVARLIKCRDMLKGLQEPPESVPHDPYKVGQLMKMLLCETDRDKTHYGARLRHEESGAKVLTIDAGGLRALISHYAMHRTELGNGEEG